MLREVDWTIYEDNVLVINGEWLVHNHGNARYSGYVNIDIRFDEDMKTVPWQKYKDEIHSVVFAEETSPLHCDYWFSGCSNLTNPSFINLDLSKATSINSMFEDCSALQFVNMSKKKTSNLQGIESLFRGCKSLRQIDCSGWDISQLQDARWTFGGCDNLKILYLINWEFPSTEVICDSMFANDYNLEKIYCEYSWSIPDDCEDVFLNYRKLQRSKSENYFTIPAMNSFLTSGGKFFTVDGKILNSTPYRY